MATLSYRFRPFRQHTPGLNTGFSSKAVASLHSAKINHQSGACLQKEEREIPETASTGITQPVETSRKIGIDYCRKDYPEHDAFGWIVRTSGRARIGEQLYGHDKGYDPHGENYQLQQPQRSAPNVSLEGIEKVSHHDLPVVSGPSIPPEIK